jgi:actin-related protein
MLVSVQQGETPLNKLFFSDFNVSTLQRGIRQSFKNSTGISIDYQARSDVLAIMRTAFINNSGDHFTHVNEQVKTINGIVIKMAVQQINSGVRQYIGYMRDAAAPLNPFAAPINTSTYGKKIDLGRAVDTIGIN